MRRLLSVILGACLVLVACSPLENQARDTAAALGGLLAEAQTQYQSTCQANATTPLCTSINKAIAAQNALVTATEAYCGWSAKTPPGDPTVKCTPVSSATGGLQAAISNANTFITELKGVVK